MITIEKKSGDNARTAGCGASSGIFGWFKPPYHLFFKASCVKHDEGYYSGGDETERWYCDNRFWLAMRYDVRRAKRGLKRQYFYFWCWLYYVTVRLLGRPQFNYKKK